MVSLYKTLVRPHVEYCVSAWSPYYKKDKELLVKVQRRFSKMINNVEGLSYEERLRCLNLWTLEERRNRQDLIEVFKIFQGKSIIGFEELFVLDKNSNGTIGHNLKLSKARCTRDCWKHFFSNRVVNRWNKLDKQIVGASSLKVFKNGFIDRLRKTQMGFFMD